MIGGLRLLLLAALAVGAIAISSTDALAAQAPVHSAAVPAAFSYGYDATPASTTSAANTSSVAFATYDPADEVSRSRMRGSGAVLAAKAGEILPKPIVGDAKLQNYVDDLFKGTTNPGRVGTGTTADAVRAERLTGQPTFGKFHTQKAEDTARGLRNWLRRNPGADPHDRLVAQSLRDELLDALGRGR